MTRAIRKGRAKPGMTRKFSSWIFRSNKGAKGTGTSWRNRGTGKIVRAPNTATEKRLDFLAKRSKNKEVTGKHLYGLDKIIGKKRGRIKGLRGF